MDGAIEVTETNTLLCIETEIKPSPTDGCLVSNETFKVGEPSTFLNNCIHDYISMIV